MEGKRSLIDWPDVHRRLEAVRKALESSEDLPPDEKKRILRARARELAQVSPEPPAIGEVLEIVQFQLAEEVYGIESVFVREVAPLKELTPLPHTPTFVRGLMSIRGELLAVIDLKRFFDLPERGLTDLNKVIVVRDERMTVGLLADRVLGVCSLSQEEIHPPLPTLTGIRHDYLRGVTRDHLVVLDGKKLLSDDRLIVREEGQTRTTRG